MAPSSFRSSSSSLSFLFRSSFSVCSSFAGAGTASTAAGAPVFAVAIDTAGKRVASGGADGIVKIWDAAEGRHLATLWSGPGSGESGDWLAVAPEGYISASEGLMAKVAWTASGKRVADTKAISSLADPKQVAKAIAGAKVPDPVWK